MVCKTVTDELVKRHRDEILRIARRHGASRVRVVGSRARGDARPDSDLDLLVDMEEGRNLFDLGGMVYDLEHLLRCPVGVAQEHALRPRIRQRVMEDAIDL